MRGERYTSVVGFEAPNRIEVGEVILIGLQPAIYQQDGFYLLLVVFQARVPVPRACQEGVGVYGSPARPGAVLDSSHMYVGHPKFLEGGLAKFRASSAASDRSAQRRSARLVDVGRSATGRQCVVMI